MLQRLVLSGLSAMIISPQLLIALQSYEEKKEYKRDFRYLGEA